MTVYDAMALKLVTNQAQTAVNGPIIMDCWFEEGNITVASAKTYSTGGVMLDRPLYSFGTVVSFADDPQDPDWVTLAPNSAEYTYAKLQGKPILELASAVKSGTVPIVGALGSDLKGPVVLPANSAAADSVAERVAGLYLRHGQVTLFGLAYYPVEIEGTTDIAPGDHLVYDISDGYWKKETSTVVSPVISCHAATDTGEYVGALFYGPPVAQA